MEDFSTTDLPLSSLISAQKYGGWKNVGETQLLDSTSTEMFHEEHVCKDQPWAER